MQSLAFRLRLQLLCAWAVGRCKKGKIDGEGWLNRVKGRGRGRENRWLCTSAWVMTTHTMAACAPIEEHGWVVRRRQPGGPEKGTRWYNRWRVVDKVTRRRQTILRHSFPCSCEYNMLGKPRTLSRRSVNIGNPLGVQADWTRDPWRIQKQQAKQDEP